MAEAVAQVHGGDAVGGGNDHLGGVLTVGEEFEVAFGREHDANPPGGVAGDVVDAADGDVEAFRTGDDRY